VGFPKVAFSGWVWPHARRSLALPLPPRGTYTGPPRGGKWVFAAPEQIPTSRDLTVRLDASTDLFSAAATAVSLVLEGGRPPFLPLDMARASDRKLSSREVLRHPLRDPAAMTQALEVCGPVHASCSRGAGG
jgi:hypothetical protein